MSITAMIVCAGMRLALGAGCVFACVALAFPKLFEIDDEDDLDPAKPAHNPIRKCKGCGDDYHEDWGRLCPNCSGAD